MTRNEVIECMARSLYKLAWGKSAYWPPHNAVTHSRFIEKATTALAALEARGMMVVPKEPTENMIVAGIAERLLSDVPEAWSKATKNIYRVMTEAHK